MATVHFKLRVQRVNTNTRAARSRIQFAARDLTEAHRHSRFRSHNSVPMPWPSAWLRLARRKETGLWRVLCKRLVFGTCSLWFYAGITCRIRVSHHGNLTFSQAHRKSTCVPMSAPPAAATPGCWHTHRCPGCWEGVGLDWMKTREGAYRASSSREGV